MQEIMQNGTEAEKLQVLLSMQRSAFKEQQMFNNNTLINCFNQCVSDFSTPQVSYTETSCVSSCTKKQIELHKHITQKLSEESNNQLSQ